MTAIAHIARAEISARSETGGTVAIFDAVPLATEILRSAGASVASVDVADGPSQFWRITAVGASIWIKIGNAPVADVGGAGCWYLTAYETIELAALPGQKVAVHE